MKIILHNEASWMPPDIFHSHLLSHLTSYSSFMAYSYLLFHFIEDRMKVQQGQLVWPGLRESGFLQKPADLQVVGEGLGEQGGSRHRTRVF